MKASELKPGQFFAKRSSVGVWMFDEYRCESVARMVAIDTMIALGLDPHDFRTRDKIITGISERINGTLDCVTGWDDEPQGEHNDRICQLESALRNALHVLEKCTANEWPALKEIVPEAVEDIKEVLGMATTAPLQLREGAVCHFCGKAAACYGTYEGMTGYSCDECCGHGNEDGYCEPIAEVPPPVEPPQPDGIYCPRCNAPVESTSGSANRKLDADKDLQAVAKPVTAGSPLSPAEQFKAGDWVVCVDDKDSLMRLRSGKVYEVVDVDETGDVAVQKGLFFWASRFRHATPAETKKATEPQPDADKPITDWVEVVTR